MFKRMLHIAAGVAGSTAIAICTARQQTLAALAKSDVQAACSIVQPSLNSL
jgi:hypothetical protein